MDRARPSAWIGFLAMLALTVPACVQTVSGTGPEATAQRYLEAVADGRRDVAWKLRASEHRRTVTQASFRARLAAITAEERKAILARSKSSLTARHEADWGQVSAPLKLVHLGGRSWAVTSPLPRFDRQGAPREALETFTHAFRSSDWETLLKLAPDAERDGLDAGLVQERLSDATVRTEVAAALDALGTSTGEADSPVQWSFRSGQHRAILILERGTWRLLDLR